ncbi:MAG TPA: DUF222 domain-containing protein [Streptosporangiaceae bacterium]|jgi:hypothetical protein|nr:DUF222 domain-containing protein [Streptosporangiaceae bacterium]
MCGGGDGMPGGIAGALRMAHAALDHLNGPEAANLPAAGLGEALRSLGALHAKLTAAHAGLLRRFDACGAHDGDGYPTTASWLAAMTKVTLPGARAAVRQMRLLGRHRAFEEAMAAGRMSPSWALDIAARIKDLPPDLRPRAGQILAEAAAAGADLDDLRLLAACAVEKWKAQQPDPGDGDGFGDRYVHLATTFGGAGVMRGDLTPECAAAVQAVLDALGKRRGPEDARTEGQRFHDAIQEACELLIRARMVPGRAGADTQVMVHIPLAGLRAMDGASELEDAWLAARAGQPGYLTGKDAEAAACDALVVPTVTGHPDMAVIGQIIEVCLAAAGPADPAGTAGLRPMSPQAYAALRMQVARLAIDFVSGPAGLAGYLRTRLLNAPYNTKSLPLDIGYSASIPAAIRRAVTLRDRHCAWPGCAKPPAACDVHHLVHKSDGGKTSVSSCVLLCQFHHDVCIHRWGWQFILHPDGTTEAISPYGEVLRSHGPPTLRAG